MAAEEHVAHGPADERQLVPGAREQLAKLGRGGRLRPQQRRGSLALVGAERRDDGSGV